jgi:deazaflavin-dependent oxidoreductase (nitroreductase family)
METITSAHTDPWGGTVAKVYRPGTGSRVINWAFRTMTNLGIGAPYRHILTVRGRKTGLPRSTPVDVMELSGTRWLVAGYGPANWVSNARAASEVTLSRGGRATRYQVSEVATADAVPVLRAYLATVRVVRPYFDAAPDAPGEALAAELARHPVLRLTPLPR